MAPHPQHKPFYSTNTSNKAPSISHQKNMSDKCGSCDCADKSQCTKKGDSYGVVMPDTSSQPFARPEVEEVTGAEHDGCKCGTSCSCTDCTCGK